MCGICGIAGPGINNSDLDIVQELLVVSSLRGTDSTGVLQGKVNNWAGRYHLDFEIEKSNCDASYFRWFHTKSKQGNRRILNTVQDNFMCCHARAATRGDITEDNAHPFEFSKIVGLHNGTLFDREYIHPTKTDSEMMLQDINDYGIIPTLELLNPNSAYAIVVFNKENGTISFARNEKRDLYFCIHEKRSVIYWASEPWMLRGIMSRNQEKIYKDQVWLFNPNRVYTCHPDLIKGGVESTEIFTTQSYQSKVKEVKVISGTKFQQQQALLSSPWTPPETKKGKEEKKIINASIDKNTKLPKYFCCSCQRQLDPLDRYYASRVGVNLYICEDCDNKFLLPMNSNEEVIVN